MGKLRKTCKFTFIFVLIFMLIVNQSAYAETEDLSKNDSINMVILIDVSGSMKTPDASGTALLFARLLADINCNSGKKIGFVAFNEDIVLSLSPNEVTDLNIDSVNQKLRELTYTKNTDLGLGLAAATQMLQVSGGQILLITDGETDLVGSHLNRTNQDNINDQNQAISICLQNNITVHSFIMKTIKTTDAALTAISAFSDETSGTNYFLDNSSDLLPQLFSSYAQTQGMSFNKAAEAESEAGLQQFNISLPYIDYMSDLSLIAIGNNDLSQCQYTDATSARISVDGRACVVSNASDTLSEQRMSVQSNGSNLISLYTLKKYDIKLGCDYSDSDHFFRVEVLDAKTSDIITSNTQLPIKVNVFENSEVSDSLTLTKEGDQYLRSFELLPGHEFSAIASTAIEDIEIKSEVVTLSQTSLAPKAIQTSYNFQKSNEIKIALSELFEYANPNALTYQILDTNITGEVYIDNGYIVLENSGRIKEGTILAEAKDPYGATAVNNIALTIKMPTYAYVLTGLAVLLVLIGLFLLFTMKPYNKKYHFTGVLSGLFIHTKHGQDIPELVWLENALAGKQKFTLQQLLGLLNVYEDIPEAKKMHFKAYGDGKILFWHQTNCNILLESKTVPRNQKYVYSYGNMLYIFFEDATTELELHYEKSQRETVNRKRLTIKINTR